ncbi:hypothetical protein E2C01_085117 [Portunus trituberculatus]|uniref:Uncharacterized protein n=1 Tax=Portunus trituberculatus TaxID=210409 RepID=A0A5B7J5U2_PORTR|nr:hypothetical protein [Portunus trituberculatus]
MHRSLPFPSPLLVQNKNGPAPAHHLTLNMPPKCPTTSPTMLPSVAKKKRKSLTLEVKLDITHRHERREN